MSNKNQFKACVVEDYQETKNGPISTNEPNLVKNGPQKSPNVRYFY